MSGFNKLLQDVRKGKKKTQTEEGKQTSDITQILELSYKEFKIIMINMLRAVAKKVDKMQEQLGNANKCKL